MSGTTTSPTVASKVTAWGSPAISVVAQLTFLTAMLVAWKVGNTEALTLLFGTAAANATTVVNFWLGSSSGSQKKDDALVTAAGQPNAPIIAAPLPGTTTTTSTTTAATQPSAHPAVTPNPAQPAP